MARININGSTLGNSLNTLLTCEEITPGDMPSYELCKIIWLYHPLGKKIVEGPIQMAQSQQREISVPKSPEERVRDQFVKQWEDDNCDDAVYQLASVTRAYGIGTLAVVCDSVAPNLPLDPKKLADLKIAWSIYDPLNTNYALMQSQVTTILPCTANPPYFTGCLTNATLSFSSFLALSSPELFYDADFANTCSTLAAFDSTTASVTCA